MINALRVFTAIVIFSSALAQAGPVYFNQNIFCKSKDNSSSVKIVFNPNEFPHLGRPGGIHVEFYTGVSSLTSMVQIIGLAQSGYHQTIRRNGQQGQVANWIEQDLQGDPAILRVDLGFTTYDLVDSSGKISAQANSFISSLRISKSRDYGFGRNGTEPNPGLRLRETYLLTIHDDFGQFSTRFQSDECGPL